MVTLADITRQSGHGSGLDALSRQFGLDSKQTTKAVEALLPAFTLAFQRLVLNPTAFSDFARAVSSGAYAPYFDNPGQSQAATSGAAVLQQLFRDPEAARQVALQAASFAGVGVQVMQQIMPTIAATIVGGMFRYATVEGFADLLRQWGDALRTASETLDPPKPQDPWSAWQTAAGQMMGLRPPPPPPKPVPEPMNVLDAWVSLVGAMTGMSSAGSKPDTPARPPAPPLPSPPLQVQHEPFRREEPSYNGAETEAAFAEQEAAPEGETAPAGPESADEPNPFEAMSQMFETGREVHAQHVAAFQSILDNVWGTTRKS